METIAPLHGKAVASLILGICSIVCWFCGLYGAIIGIALGIIGIVMASQAKKARNTEGIRTGGLVCSIVGLAGSGIAFVIALGAIVALGALAVAFG